MKIFNTCFVHDFINKGRTVPGVHAPVRNNERKMFTGLTCLSAIKQACDFCIKLLVVENQIFGVTH